MSGDDQAERGTPPDGMRARAAKAESQPAPAGPPPLPQQQAAPAPAAAPAARVRKQKASPGIIMAGGLDMARGHAENIQPKTLGAAHTPEVPRVVLSVETDLRRAPTMPRLIPAGKPNGALFPAPAEAAATAPTSGDGKASPWGAIPVPVAVDKRDLPSANLPVTAPVAAPEKKKGGGWLRYAVVLMLLLLAAGIVRRVRMTAGPDDPGTPQHTIAVAPPLPPEATADPTATAAAARPRNPSGALPAGTVDPAADVADASADLDAADLDAGDLDAGELESDAALPRVRVAPPPPKPTFKPLFELPQEKAKGSP